MMTLDSPAAEGHCVGERAARAPVLLALSARTPGALRALAAQWAMRLVDHAWLSLDDAASTLHVGRIAHPHRFAVVTADVDDAVAALHAFAECGVLQPGAAVGMCEDGGQCARRASGLQRHADASAHDVHALAQAWVMGTEQAPSERLAA